MLLQVKAGQRLNQKVFWQIDTLSVFGSDIVIEVLNIKFRLKILQFQNLKERIRFNAILLDKTYYL